MWEIQLLGGFQATDAEGNTVSFRTKREKALLAYLILNPDKPLDRQLVAQAIWEDHDAPRSLLSTEWHYLRKEFNSHNGGSQQPLISTQQTIQLNSRYFQSDVARLQVCLKESRSTSESRARRAEKVATAVQLYERSGELLPELSGTWITTQRHRFDALYEEAKSDLLTLRDPEASRPFTVDELETMNLAALTAFVKQADVHFRTQDERTWFQKLENRQQACLAAIEAEIKREATPKVLLSPMLWNLWQTRGHSKRVRDWLLERVLAQSVAKVPLPFVHRVIGDTSIACGDFRLARKHLEQALALFQRRKDIGCVAGTLTALTNEANHRGDRRRQVELGEQALALYVDMGNQQIVMEHLIGSARAFMQIQDFKSAEDRLRSGIRLARILSNRQREAEGLMELAIILAQQGRWKEADSNMMEGRRLAASVSDPRLLRNSHYSCAIVEELRGNALAALRWHSKCLSEFHHAGDLTGQIEIIRHMVSVCAGVNSENDWMPAGSSRVNLLANRSACHAIARLAGVRASLCKRAGSPDRDAKGDPSYQLAISRLKLSLPTSQYRNAIQMGQTGRLDLTIQDIAAL